LAIEPISLQKKSSNTAGVNFINICARLFFRAQDEELFWQMAFGKQGIIKLVNFTLHIGQIPSAQFEAECW